MTPLTIEQWRAQDTPGSRPLTQDPIGTFSTGRRQTDKANSAAVGTRNPRRTVADTIDQRETP